MSAKTTLSDLKIELEICHDDIKFLNDEIVGYEKGKNKFIKQNERFMKANKGNKILKDGLSSWDILIKSAQKDLKNAQSALRKYEAKYKKISGSSIS